MLVHNVESYAIRVGLVGTAAQRKSCSHEHLNQSCAVCDFYVFLIRVQGIMFEADPMAYVIAASIRGTDGERLEMNLPHIRNGE